MTELREFVNHGLAYLSSIIANSKKKKSALNRRFSYIGQWNHLY